MDDTAQRRLRSLAEASRILASSLDFEDTLAQVARIVVPEFADWCSVYVADDGGGFRCVDVAHRDPVRAAEVRDRTQRQSLSPAVREGLYRAILSGEPRLLPELGPAQLERGAADGEHLELLMRLGLRSGILIPLRARGRTLGAVLFATSESGRSYRPADLEFATEFALRAALAVDNARLFREAERAREAAERRAKGEAALRRSAEAINASHTVEDVLHRIVDSALDATESDGVTLEWLDQEREELEVVAVAGARTLRPGTRLALAGTAAAAVLERGDPLLIPQLSGTERNLALAILLDCVGCSALFVPLADAAGPIGALILLREPGRPPFEPDDLDRARTFAELTAVAIRKVQLLEESERRREELERVLESRARLIRGFSHDLKNPLGAADGHAALLEQRILGELTERQLDSVLRIRHSIGSALGLIQDLIELAHAETGQLDIRSEHVDAGDVAREAVAEYGAQAGARNITLELEVGGPVPAIRSDRSRVRQILGNLIANAVKYTPPGGRVTVSVAARPRPGALNGGDWVGIAVADTGPGIPAARQKEIFREFIRLNPLDGGGAGVGLAISHRIAKLLGADLVADSRVGHGSTFTLWLPVDRPGART